MKLKKLDENKNSKFFNDKKSVYAFIIDNYNTKKRFQPYASLDESDFTINDDLSVDFHVGVTIRNTHDNSVKINKCKELILDTECKIYDTDFLPVKANGIIFNNPDFYNSDLHIQSKVSKSILFESCMFGEGFNDTHVKTIKIDNSCADIKFNSCRLLNINIYTKKSIQVMIEYCTHMKYENLHIGKTDKLFIINNGLTTFKGIKHLNKCFIESLYTDANYIDNFLNIDELEIHYLSLTKVKTVKNIITLLLAKIDVFTLETPLARYFGCRDIIVKYMQISQKQRSDHVMDCAVELIDAGFEEAAEL